MPDITFRSDDGTRWGAGKGANLTPVEVDLNFWFLFSNVEMLLTHSPTPTNISGFRVVGSQFYVDMDDHSTFGPFPLPIAAWTFKFEWAPLTNYVENNVITNNGSTYLVLLAHESAASFDSGANDGHGHDFYGLMMSAPADVLPVGGDVGDRLAKRTDHNFDVEWVPDNGIPAGGSSGTILTKNSNNDYDTVWRDPIRTLTPKTVTNHTYDITSADESEYLRFTFPGSVIVMLVLNATQAVTTGAEITLRDVTLESGGGISIETESGVILNIPTGYQAISACFHASLTLKKVDTDEWDLMGLLLPV